MMKIISANLAFKHSSFFDKHAKDILRIHLEEELKTTVSLPHSHLHK